MISVYTARMTIAPVTTVCHSCGTDRMRSPLVRTLMMKAPMIVPKMVPSPPLSEVPPITTAAIASYSYPAPREGWAEFNREAISTPARPLNIPQSV